MRLSLFFSLCLAIVGCTTSVTPPLGDGGTDSAYVPDSHTWPDASRPDTTSAPDGTHQPDSGGTWEECCESGEISTCYCPPGTACNYGWFTRCGGNTCVAGPLGECPRVDAGVDASPEDAGTWEDCCVDGQITTCHCPGGAICNYGWFTRCGGNSCVGPTLMCPADGGVDAADSGEDAGPSDAGVDGPIVIDAGPVEDGGTWEHCCTDGLISTCYCPPGFACNYGRYNECGGGTCSYFDEPCPDIFVDAGIGL